LVGWLGRLKLVPCEHNSWDFDRDLYGFPSTPALKSLHLGLKLTLHKPNELSFPPDVGGKLMNLVWNWV